MRLRDVQCEVIVLFYKWSGRVDEYAKGKRIHQIIENVKVDQLEKTLEKSFGIVGFTCDEGVRRNQGRVGAKKAPNEIRKFLANIAYHPNKENIIDIGNITCIDEKLEEAQEKLGRTVARLIEYNYTPIILGGGHETFYGHYLGVRKALGKDKMIGMINLDAHFDLRIDSIPSSGTMFRQILETDPHANYLCLGIQELANTEQLFLTAKKYGVEYLLATELEPLENTFAKIKAFSQKHDVMIYTICTDVMNQAIAPGVSAPNPFGLAAETVRAITKHVVTQENFLSIDVSEVNPNYDVEHMTARLISYMIGEVLHLLNKNEGR